MRSTFGATEQPRRATCAGVTSRRAASRDYRAGEYRFPAARPAQRAERHERDAAAEALREDRGFAAVGQVEQVLHADDLGCDGAQQLVEATLLSPTPAISPSSRAATIAASWASKRRRRARRRACAG